MTKTVGCSAIGKHHAVKAGGGEGRHSRSLLEAWLPSPGVSCVSVLLPALVSAGSIFLKAQITASDIRDEGLYKAYLLKYV